MTPVTRKPFSFESFFFTANLTSALILLYLLAHVLIDPAGFEPFLMKDSPVGAGPAEDLTVVFLVIGLFFAVPAVIRHRKRFPDKWLLLWASLWCAGCVFFAGEEISWGQWYFGWDTPEVWAEFNYQEETNLHNTTSWLNQKPRAAVEIFMFLFGLVLPLRHLVTRKTLFEKEPWKTREIWTVAPALCIGPAILFMVTRIAAWMPSNMYVDPIGNGEMREFATAWFLMWYLITYRVRLREAGDPSA